MPCLRTLPRNSAPNLSFFLSTSPNTLPKVLPRLLLATLSKAHDIREVIAKYDSNYLAVSSDEAYLNITTYVAENHLEPAEVVTQLRAEIFEKTQITVSAGLAASIFLL